MSESVPKSHIYNVMTDEQDAIINERKREKIICNFLLLILVIIFIFSMCMAIYCGTTCNKVYINETLTINEAYHMYPNKWHIDDNNHIYYIDCPYLLFYCC